MKVLIVDDNTYKIDQVIYALKGKGIENYDIAESTREVIYKIIANKNTPNKYNLIISDLGLPIFKNELVSDSLEGFNMLLELAYRSIYTPTIVYSTTDIPSKLIEELKSLHYQYLGQAKDIGELKELLKTYLESNTSREQIKPTARKLIKVGDIIPWN